MGLLPDWSQKGLRPEGSFGQYTQSNMFTNPTYEQQGKPQQLANMLRQQSPNQMQQQVPGINPNQMYQNPMQPQAFQANPQNNNLIIGGDSQNLQNWNSQYGSY